MTVLSAATDVIQRDPTLVMGATCADLPVEIQRLWPKFEHLVGLQGRKMYALVDVEACSYVTCTPIRADDDANALELQVTELPGGRYRRGRVCGEPPAIYALIAPGVAELMAAGAADATRPIVEFYKRRDEIELWVPIGNS